MKWEKIKGEIDGILFYNFAGTEVRILCILRLPSTNTQGTVREWIRCNSDIPYIKENNSSMKYHLNLTTKGYRALIYSGDHDLQVPFVGTQAWIRSLNFSIVDEWRSWSVDGQVAGYTRAYANNLTFAIVKARYFWASLYDISMN
ncbi:serine carboxypeptidase-like protein 17 isoform X3 [Cinnamomum micranthum f. kanehirae]|uniref:Serine carboxypeptidase-like protein 17 isoform X3 n=1 Tax=Cinnamomum micranthum f. kanehirae TaxID=337451 RepID=A0A443NVH2_9MAGN|nr:serine carboxypeptidase-like protein 17 isoform X3 [Cinnamomum micranthum f. kanehirae]